MKVIGSMMPQAWLLKAKRGEMIEATCLKKVGIRKPVTCNATSLCYDAFTQFTFVQLPGKSLLLYRCVETTLSNCPEC